MNIPHKYVVSARQTAVPMKNEMTKNWAIEINRRMNATCGTNSHQIEYVVKPPSQNETYEKCHLDNQII